MHKFQVIELKYAHPQTGCRFWIEREIETLDTSWRGLFGLLGKKNKSWEIFHDPASTEINTGYKTLQEATFVIDRYRINMTPILHKY